MIVGIIPHRVQTKKTESRQLPIPAKVDPFHMDPNKLTIANLVITVIQVEATDNQEATVNLEVTINPEVMVSLGAQDNLQLPVSLVVATIDPEVELTHNLEHLTNLADNLAGVPSIKEDYHIRHLGVLA